MTADFSASDFVRRWAHSELREQQGAQSHFNELCQLVSHRTPAEIDPLGEQFTFEKQVIKADGRPGRADVWYRERFAWEYKGKHKDLDAAYHQLLSYKTALENPPLLVVCDFLEYRIYPQWTNTSADPFVFHNADLVQPSTQNYIRWLLTDPHEFLEARKRELGERAAITERLAKDFAKLADQLRLFERDGTAVWSPLQVARFLTKLVFALFAEDIGLLPHLDDQPVFRYLVEKARRYPKEFAPTLRELFAAMNGDRATFALKPVPFFNGGLFAESVKGANDGIEVLDLTDEAVTAGALETLEKVANADWRKVNPTIFGTLFEAALDKGKRAQLGAHYTSEEDIRLIVEPVLMSPLQREWAALQVEAEPLMQHFTASETPPNQRQTAREQLIVLRNAFLTRLGAVRVLDPACGSGNFLYVSLKALKDLEGRVHQYFAPLDLPFRDVVTPRQLFGIEKDAFAAKLAHIVVWIGYLQWRYEDAGSLKPVSGEPSHKREISVPILNDKTEEGGSRILNDDAILRYDAAGDPIEPIWPDADVIMGNPPFLGAKKMIGELGEKYVHDLRKLYGGRLPGFSDLVTFWFERARHQIELNKTKRAGLLATNSISMGTNLTVLKRIKETGDIFLAWSDREWILEGAAVRVAIIGFDNNTQVSHELDGKSVAGINADLTTSTVDLTKAKPLTENKRIGFVGAQKNGSFDIDQKLAQIMLAAANPEGHSNANVLFRYSNSEDLTRRSRNIWIIDFGTNMTQSEAEKYKIPFQHVQTHVYPTRKDVRRNAHRERWWLHGDTRPGLRQAIKPLNRYLVTPTVSKHRLFVWFEKQVYADHQLIVFARDDDYFFGALHSYMHECWSLRMGTWLGKGNDPRYTPTTTFETFPFPWSPGKEPKDDPCLLAIAAAAKALDSERAAWLNPPELAGSLLKNRTLTNLYNALEKFRASQKAGKAWLVNESEPGTKFAARLATLHAALDSAVLAAYGWSDLADQLRSEAGDEELLRRLLALNQARAAL